MFRRPPPRELRLSIREGGAISLRSSPASPCFVQALAFRRGQGRQYTLRRNILPCFSPFRPLPSQEYRPTTDTLAETGWTRPTAPLAKALGRDRKSPRSTKQKRKCSAPARESCPMQDEPEGEECFQHKMSLKMNKPGQGTMRVNASHHAACRTSHPRRDARIPRRQQHSQLRRHRPQADLRPSRTRLAHSKVPRFSQERQRESCAAIWSRSADSAKRKSPV